MDFPFRLSLQPDTLCKFTDCRKIMRPVKDNSGKNLFHSSLPFNRCNHLLPFADFCLVAKCISHRPDCKCCVHHLIDSGARHLPYGIIIILIQNRKSNMFVCNFLNFQRIFFHFIPRCFYIFGSFFYNPTTSFIRAVKKYRYAFFDDSGFFSRDLFNRISKDLCVIQSDRCDHAQERMLEGISRIQPSTKSCLQYNILCITLFKCKHPHSIQEFKIRRMFHPFLFQFFCHLPHLCKNPAEGIIVNIFSIDPDPLVELHQMW